MIIIAFTSLPVAYNYQDGTALRASSYTEAGKGVAGEEKESLQEPHAAILALEIDMTTQTDN